ncbi:hypothetical protein HMPREF6745_2264 [Prevotella sp. oral taxon 472 str. F0295]|nr:hypothetical protein HMPREF6745_2264 [Prevotella sp. oral taxon 472 str. F0295]
MIILYDKDVLGKSIKFFPHLLPFCMIIMSVEFNCLTLYAENYAKVVKKA